MKITNICCFDETNPSPFLSVPSLFSLHGSLLMVLKRIDLLVLRWVCRLEDGQSFYCRSS